MDREALAREAKRLIDRIAETPRGAGTDGEARARTFCAEYLMRAGFAVTEEEFTYSALPGKWAVPLFGLISLAWFLVMAAAPYQARQEHTMRMAMALLPLLPILYFGARRLMRRPRFMRRRACNLVAIRGGAPGVWLMAHLDTKSQPVPMLLRMSGIIVASAAMVTTFVASLFTEAYRGNYLFFWGSITALGAVGSLAVLLSTVGNRSPGALDNASGVAAAVLGGAGTPSGMPVGVLLTSAEELGLAGARAWARDQAVRHATRHKRYVINFDGLDDVGTLTCMSNRDNPVAAALSSAASEAGMGLRLRKVLPGIMVDSSALSESDWDAVTVSKGNLSTLARIHTPSDAPDRLAGAGVAEAVEMVLNFMKREA